MAGGIINNGRRPGARRSYRPMAEINVTPMVDVMLVLLIVFMVAAPLLTTGVPVDLPKAQAQAINEQKDPLTVSVKAEGQIYIQDTPIADTDLVAKLQAITNNNPDAPVFVRGDKNINYGRVMEVMGLIASAGFVKVSLITNQPDTPSPASRK